jgi:hypothetical protein
VNYQRKHVYFSQARITTTPAIPITPLQMSLPLVLQQLGAYKLVKSLTALSTPTITAATAATTARNCNRTFLSLSLQNFSLTTAVWLPESVVRFATMFAFPERQVGDLRVRIRVHTVLNSIDLFIRQLVVLDVRYDWGYRMVSCLVVGRVGGDAREPTVIVNIHLGSPRSILIGRYCFPCGCASS